MSQICPFRSGGAWVNPVVIVAGRNFSAQEKEENHEEEYQEER